jgi:hypothetical protein
VLDLTVREALTFFSGAPKVLRRLQVLDEIGLGYLRLGQPATTLSGGEAQRIKIAAHLASHSGERLLYILDEPTTGLHFDDIAKLLAAFRKLLEAGHIAARDRAQPRRHQDGRLDHRPRPRGRRGRRARKACHRDRARPSRWRALAPLDGLDLMRQRRGGVRWRIGKPPLQDHELCRGPGNLTTALGITLAENESPLTGPALTIEDHGESLGPLVWTPRIGISSGQDRLWRCIVAGHRSVSGNRASARKLEGKGGD